MLEIGFVLFIVAIVVALFFVTKEYGGAIAEKDHAQDKLRGVEEIMKGVEDDKELRNKVKRDTIAGNISNSLRKYYRD
jgi:hypothetical protein